MATENIENKIFAGENNISVEQVEEAVISALLLDAGAIVGTFPVLKPEMFSRPGTWHLSIRQSAIFTTRGKRWI